MIALVRTAVPAAWSALVAWLATHLDLPEEALTHLGETGSVVLVPLALAVIYPASRWLEARSWWPAWLTRILLGSARPPRYD
ncbi:hypothetical protein SAMN06265360_10611 [Haloechinothrix alba]|uniref:Uncharacterized protein n=1 Tax=Haloechinothrix alba TaxID=664784 RepID=A0A238WC36_9PSEU|nr:hypothetical protein [Haloechinothrix alba]SNR43977.1 hypothetical protein SAMN06265360_10611 [Haloechinothrix alba]